MRRFLARYQRRVHYFDMVNDYGTVLSAGNRDKDSRSTGLLKAVPFADKRRDNTNRGIICTRSRHNVAECAIMDCVSNLKQTP